MKVGRDLPNQMLHTEFFLYIMFIIRPLNQRDGFTVRKKQTKTKGKELLTRNKHSFMEFFFPSEEHLKPTSQVKY